MIIRGFIKAFMDVKLDTAGLKIKNDKILFERVGGFIKKQQFSKIFKKFENEKIII